LQDIGYLLTERAPAAEGRADQPTDPNHQQHPTGTQSEVSDAPVGGRRAPPRRLPPTVRTGHRHRRGPGTHLDPLTLVGQTSTTSGDNPRETPYLQGHQYTKIMMTFRHHRKCTRAVRFTVPPPRRWRCSGDERFGLGQDDRGQLGRDKSAAAAQGNPGPSCDPGPKLGFWWQLHPEHVHGRSPSTRRGAGRPPHHPPARLGERVGAHHQCATGDLFQPQST